MKGMNAMRIPNLPLPAGPYAVGTFTYTVPGSREDALRSGTLRCVPARVWYPAEKESVKGLTQPPVLSDNMLRGYKLSFKVTPKIRNHPEMNVSACYEDAPWIPGKKFPLILFNHGYNSYREGNSFLCIELASRGYVVISVAHSLEGLCTEPDGGPDLFFDKTITKKVYQPLLPALFAMLKLTRARGTDEELAERFDAIQRKYCSFMMSRLPEWVKDNEEALAWAKENLRDLIDFEKGIGVSGHSMGGNAAYALCARNPEITCGVNIDGALFGDYREDVLKKPFLQICCADNEKAETRAFLRHTRPVCKVLFRDMKHTGFADAKYLMPMKSATGRLAPDLLHENLCACHLAFFDAYLKREREIPDIRSNDVITVTVREPDME